MHRWSVFIKERFALIPLFILCAGIGVSGALLSGSPLRPGLVAVSIAALLLFMLELRLMDELKDYDKDLVAHPARPLPRGLLTVKEVRLAVSCGLGIMVAIGGLLWLLANLWAASLYLICTTYLFLMYKEFFVGARLSKRPFLYAATHQVVLLPYCAFAVVINRATAVSEATTWAFGILVLGAFFCYEIGRKLDPSAHPILDTYLTRYGTAVTAAAMAVTLALAAYGAYLSGVQLIALPFVGLVLASLILLFNPAAFKGLRRRHKIVEAVVSLNLLVHVWSIVLGRLLL